MQKNPKFDQTKYLSSKELKELSLSAKDIFFFSLFIYVIHPVRGKVRFNLYPYQKSVVYQFLKERFNIILKFRQAGITELISMYCLWLAMFHPNKKIHIISIKDIVAKKVLKKIKFMYKNLPPHLQVPIVNGRSNEYGTAEEMEFINGSVITSIPTTEDAGRSESLSLLVIDEAAIVRWASSIWAAAFPTLSTGGSAIINSCITGDTNIITRKGNIRVDSICPKKFGKKDISSMGLETLTHTGKWKRIIGSVNKGELETWVIKNKFGEELKCTPNHKLLTSSGWKPVKDIIKHNLNAIFFDTGLGNLISPPETTPPKIEILKDIKGYPNYKISNLGKVYIKKGNNLIEKSGSINNRGYNSIKLWKDNTNKKFMVLNLVATHFIGRIPKGYIVDHVNNIPTDNYVTNLNIVTTQENTLRASKYSRGMNLGNNIGKGFPDLQVVGYIKERAHLIKVYGDGSKLAKEVSQVFGKTITTQYVTRLVREERCHSVYVSELTLIKKYVDTIYDICVEDDESYINNTHYVSHNTPYGVGNFYHGTWVDAISGGNPFNPIRLYWQMHPERDQTWYDEMAAALGTKRTAQEIDGDFLSSGNSVFDLTDIKAIEDSLSEYPAIRTRFNGQYREFKEPEPDKLFSIGADCATGRATDYSSFTCMDNYGEEYAVYKGKMPLDKYAIFLGNTGRKFNYAKIAPETNDIGIAVTLTLQNESYPNLYHSTRLL